MGELDNTPPLPAPTNTPPETFEHKPQPAAAVYEYEVDESTSTWKCSTCTFANKLDKTHCEMCAKVNPKPQKVMEHEIVTPPQPPTKPQASWMCPNCPTENVSGKCTFCHTPKPSTHKWECSECTYVNDPKVCAQNGHPGHCDMCSAPNVKAD